MNACARFAGGSSQAVIVSEAEQLKYADKIILPGVGSFGEAAAELKARKLLETLKAKIQEGAPFLGICLGMHLLLERSQESPGAKGLGLIKGEVLKFKSAKIKVPHIGWNDINAKSKTQNAKILKDVADGSYVYFCHSYYVKPDDEDVVVAITDYGLKFASIIAKDNIFGIQFHPEKSQAAGLKILENFIKL